MYKITFKLRESSKDWYFTIVKDIRRNNRLQEWCSGPESIPARCHVWVEFKLLVVTLLGGFFFEFSGFPLSTKTNISKYQLEQGRAPA